MSFSAHAPRPGDAELKARLQAAGVSQRALARELDIPLSTLGQWLNGRFPPSSPDGIERLRAWLDAHEMGDLLHVPSPESGGRRAHLRLLPTPPPTPEPEEEKMEIISREYLTQQELERFQIPVDPSTGERPDPFDGPEDPTDIFLSPSIRAAEAILWEAVKKKQIVIFTGEPGAGKSTLVRRAYGQARRQKQMRFLSCATLNRSRVTHATLVTAMLRDLVGRDTSHLSQEQRDELLRVTLADLRGVFPVLFLDEAHHLSNQALLAIKHVWDSHTLFRQLAVVLVGHPTLAARMNSDAQIREFTMRARVVELPAFDAPTTQAYLDWRFSRVRAKPEFTPAAVELLARRGRYPLLIHNLAIRAMRAAAPTGRVVEAEHLGRV